METISGLDPEALNRARISRDARFDGKFFIAVTSTGIYCRPICPSRVRQRRHVRFFGSAAAAEAAGFRPCLRCRPEAAPGTPAWLGTAAVVRRALRLIDEGALDEDSVETLAARLGIGPRHLLRLFARHVGRLADRGRADAAPALRRVPARGTEPADHADRAGRRLRQLPALQRRVPQRLPASAARAAPGAAAGACGEARPRRSCCGSPTVRRTTGRTCASFSRRAPSPGVERVDAQRLCAHARLCEGGQRSSRCDALPGEDALELRVTGAPPTALLQLVLDRAAGVRPRGRSAAHRQRARRGSADRAAGARCVRDCAFRARGTAFECAVRAVLGQQVSVAAGRTLATRRVVARAGEPLRAPPGVLTHLFPTPARLARARTSTGSGSRARAPRPCTRWHGPCSSGASISGGPRAGVAALAALPGIGPWTAQYVALRALGEPDALPAGTWCCAAWPRRRAPSWARAQLETRARGWRPWRVYATVHLWRAAADAGAAGRRAASETAGAACAPA